MGRALAWATVVLVGGAPVLFVATVVGLLCPPLLVPLAVGVALGLRRLRRLARRCR